jgi:hypothetical protein
MAQTKLNPPTVTTIVMGFTDRSEGFDVFMKLRIE